MKRRAYTDLTKWKQDAKAAGATSVRKVTTTKTYTRYIALMPGRGIFGFFHDQKEGQKMTHGEHGGQLEY